MLPRKIHANLLEIRQLILLMMLGRRMMTRGRYVLLRSVWDRYGKKQNQKKMAIQATLQRRNSRLNFHTMSSQRDKIPSWRRMRRKNQVTTKLIEMGEVNERQLFQHVTFSRPQHNCQEIKGENERKLRSECYRGKQVRHLSASWSRTAAIIRASS